MKTEFPQGGDCGGGGGGGHQKVALRLSDSRRGGGCDSWRSGNGSAWFVVGQRCSPSR